MRASHRGRRLLPLGILCGGALFVPPALAQTPAPPPPAPAPAPAPASTAAPAATSSLSTGGLAPPPALESTPAPGATPNTPAATEAELAKADKEDSGRGLEFVWLAADVGVMHLGLETFKNDKILAPPEERSTQTGLVAGAGAGVRLVFLTLGARFRYAPLPDMKLWSLSAEGGIHAPFGAFEPYGTLALGYVSVGSIAFTDASVAIHGFDARLGGGFDYYLTNMFSLGVNAGVDLLMLSRSGSCTQGLAAGGPEAVYCTDGSSIGGAVTATALAGLHF